MFTSDFDANVSEPWKEGDVLMCNDFPGWSPSIYGEPENVPWGMIFKFEYKIAARYKPKPEPDFYTTFELAGCWFVDEGIFAFIGNSNYIIEQRHKDGWKWTRLAGDVQHKDTWKSLDKNEVKK